MQSQSNRHIRMTWVPETAFVLAAGLGTRMRPLTETVPKPLVRFLGKPLIDHVLDRISDAGIPRAVVNVHHHAEKLEAHLSTRTKPRITISDERDALLDTGGGALRALPELGAVPFLIHNSDSVWSDENNINLKRLIVAWDATRMDTLMLLAERISSLGYEGRGDFEIAADGKLSRRKLDQDAPYVFTGVSIVHPRLFRDAPEGRFSLNKLWDRAILEGRLYGIVLEGIWMHIGTPEALDEAENRVMRQSAP
jgi:MurNAc alpha-1-phosphate uridylyltransferase